MTNETLKDIKIQKVVKDKVRKANMHQLKLHYCECGKSSVEDRCNTCGREIAWATIHLEHVLRTIDMSSLAITTTGYFLHVGTSKATIRYDLESDFEEQGNEVYSFLNEHMLPNVDAY